MTRCFRIARGAAKMAPIPHMLLAECHRRGPIGAFSAALPSAPCSVVFHAVISVVPLKLDRAHRL
jgi:hypothetical protein